MDEKERQSAFVSALTTEHFVLQSASSTTVTESAARASIYVMSLSSSLVAIGFASQSREAFGPLVAAVVPALFSARRVYGHSARGRQWTVHALPRQNGSAPQVLQLPLSRCRLVFRPRTRALG